MHTAVSSTSLPCTRVTHPPLLCPCGSRRWQLQHAKAVPQRPRYYHQGRGPWADVHFSEPHMWSWSWKCRWLKFRHSANQPQAARVEPCKSWPWSIKSLPSSGPSTRRQFSVVPCEEASDASSLACEGRGVRGCVLACELRYPLRISAGRHVLTVAHIPTTD
jgi:hypothetical protein